MQAVSCVPLLVSLFCLLYSSTSDTNERDQLTVAKQHLAAAAEVRMLQVLDFLNPNACISATPASKGLIPAVKGPSATGTVGKSFINATPQRLADVPEGSGGSFSTPREEQASEGSTGGGLGDLFRFREKSAKRLHAATNSVTSASGGTAQQGAAVAVGNSNGNDKQGVAAVERPPGFLNLLRSRPQGTPAPIAEGVECQVVSAHGQGLAGAGDCGPGQWRHVATTAYEHGDSCREHLQPFKRQRLYHQRQAAATPLIITQPQLNTWAACMAAGTCHADSCLADPSCQGESSCFKSCRQLPGVLPTGSGPVAEGFLGPSATGPGALVNLATAPGQTPAATAPRATTDSAPGLKANGSSTAATAKHARSTSMGAVDGWMSRLRAAPAVAAVAAVAAPAVAVPASAAAVVGAPAVAMGAAADNQPAAAAAADVAAAPAPRESSISLQPPADDSWLGRLRADTAMPAAAAVAAGASDDSATAGHQPVAAATADDSWFGRLRGSSTAAAVANAGSATDAAPKTAAANGSTSTEVNHSSNNPNSTHGSSIASSTAADRPTTATAAGVATANAPVASGMERSRHARGASLGGLDGWFGRLRTPTTASSTPGEGSSNASASAVATDATATGKVLVEPPVARDGVDAAPGSSSHAPSAVATTVSASTSEPSDHNKIPAATSSSAAAGTCANAAAANTGATAAASSTIAPAAPHNGLKIDTSVGQTSAKVKHARHGSLGGLDGLFGKLGFSQAEPQPSTPGRKSADDALPSPRTSQTPVKPAFDRHDIASSRPGPPTGAAGPIGQTSSTAQTQLAFGQTQEPQSLSKQYGDMVSTRAPQQEVGKVKALLAAVELFREDLARDLLLQVSTN